MNIQINNKEKLLKFFLEITDNDKKSIDYIQNLIDVYPNILDYMLSNTMPNLDNVKYVKYKRYNFLKEKVLLNYDILKLNSLLDDAFSIEILTKIKKYYFNKYSFQNIDTINSFIVKDIKNAPYDTLCKLDGIGFIKADKILLEAYNKSKNIWKVDLRSSVYRCVSFIIWYLLNCLNGSTVTTKNNLIQAMKYKYQLNDCIISFNDALLDNRLHVINENVMLTSCYLEEKNISNFIKNAINIDYTKNNIWNINVENYSEINSFKLTNEQVSTLTLVNNHQFVLLNGYAGTGKSSSIKALINMLEDNEKTYKILAPTAKAAKQISLYTQRQASTIHYLLCHDFPDFDTHLQENTEFDIISNIDEFKITKCDTLDYDMIIIDESSMLSVQLFNILIRYIDSNRTKLLMIGDSYQLPSIQKGNLYQDLLSINEIPKVTLNTIFRYTEDGLVNVATNIRLGHRFLNNDKIQYIGNSYVFYEFENILEMINSALNKYMELLNEGNKIEDIAILTAKNIGNSGTYLINTCIQKIINPISEFDNYISINVDKNIIRFKENDIVMNIKNNYGASSLNNPDKKILIANGQTGIVKQINILDNTMIVEIDGEKFKFDYADICNLRLAYCFTIHKAQGSQFKNIIYLTTREDSLMTNANLEYVAITRAQEKCYHYGSRFTVNNGVTIRENLKRNTSLVNQYYNVM